MADVPAGASARCIAGVPAQAVFRVALPARHDRHRYAGHPLLDAETLATVRGGGPVPAPVPAPPPEIGGDPVEVMVPAAFSIRRR